MFFKRVVACMICMSMLLGAMPIYRATTAAAAEEAGGVSQMTIPVTRDTFVRGYSGADTTFWDDKLLKARDGDDKQQQEGQFLVPYVQFQIPSKDVFSDVDIASAKIRMYISSNANTEASNYFVAYSQINGLPDVSGGIPVFSKENSTRPINYKNILYYEFGKNSNGREWLHMLPLKIPNTETEIPAESNQWVEFDVTEKVKELIANNVNPQEAIFAICFESGGSYQSEIAFCSQEYDDEAFRPQLTIDMTGKKHGEISATDDLTLTQAGKDAEGKTLSVETDTSEAYLTYDLSEMAADMSDPDAVLSEMNISFNVEEIPKNNQTTISVDLVEPYDTNSISWNSKPDIVKKDLTSILTMDVESNTKVTFDLMSAIGTVLPNLIDNEKMTVRISASSYFDMGSPFVISSSKAAEKKLRPTLSYALQYGIEETDEIGPGGATELDIPSGGSITSNYYLMKIDQKGGRIPVGNIMSLVWSIEGNADGVNIDENGVLTVTSDAQPGEIDIRVTQTDTPVLTGTLTVSLKKDTEKNIRIVGPDGLAIPQVGETITQQYTAHITDMAGEILAGESVIWELESPVNGVEIANDGTLTISDSTILPATLVSIRATLASNPVCSDAIDIELSKAVYVTENYYIPTAQENCVQQNNSTQGVSLLMAKQNTTTGNIDPNKDYFGVHMRNRESYLQFKGLSDIQEIKEATLYLTIAQDNAPTSMYTDLYKMPDEWAATNARVPNVTGPGMTKIGSADYNWKKDTQISFDVTEALKEKVDSKASAFSVRIAMRPVNADKDNHAFYSSKNAAASDEQKPHIILNGTVISKVGAVTLDGPTQVEIGDSAQTVAYKASLIDKFGSAFSDEDAAGYDIKLEMTNSLQGVSFDAETGELTVAPDAKNGIVVLEAGLSNRPDIKVTVDVQVYKTELSRITVARTDANDRSVVIPNKGETAKATFRADCFDQYNNLLEPAAGDIVFTLANPMMGVEVDEITGEVTIFDYAVSGREFTVVATSKTSPTVSGRFGVRILAQAAETPKERPFLLFSKEDVPELQTKAVNSIATSYYDLHKSRADAYTVEEMRYMATDYWHDDPAYPGSGKQVHKTAWQDFVSMFEFFQPYAFTPPKDAKYVKLQVLAQGQGVTHFDNVSMNIVRGNTADVPNASFETGLSEPDQWEYVIANEVLDEEGNPTGKDSKGREVAADFVWEDQGLYQEKIASDGKRSVRIDNKTPYTRAGIESDFIPVKAGAQYNANVWFGANEKLTGEKGPLPDYDENGNLSFKQLDPTAGVGMVTLYYDENKNLIGSHDYKNQGGYNIINWQVNTRRLTEDMMYNTIAYVAERDKNYAEKAKIELMMGNDDMIFGSAYVKVGGNYNHKFRDNYEAVHLGRSLASAIYTYDMIYDSGVISPEEDAKIKEGFRQLIIKLTDASYEPFTKRPTYNYNAERLTAILLYTLSFPEDTTSRAITNRAGVGKQTLWDHCMDPKNSWSLPSVLNNAIWESGSWNESFRYGGTVFGTWISLFSAIDRVKPELNIFEEPKFKKMCEFYVNYEAARALCVAAPGYASYFPVGDFGWQERAVRFTGQAAYIYADKDPELSKQLMYTWERSGKPVASIMNVGVLLYHDENLPSKRPALSSMFLQDDKAGKYGHTMFRQNYDVMGKESSLLMVNSPAYGGSPGHDHCDRGSIQLIANNIPMIIDLSIGGYIASDTSFYTSSRSHSVIQFKNGNKYENNSGKTSGSVDSETVDTYFSKTFDYSAMKVNKNDSGKTFTRHIAYVKNGINAYVMWDEVDGNKESSNNFYLVSTDVTQNGSTITAKCHNNMDLDILSLAPQNPEIQVEWAPTSNNWGLPYVNGKEQVQHLEYGQKGGKDYLTVLYPKDTREQSLTQKQIDTGIANVSAFQLSKGDDYFYVITNKTNEAVRVSLGNTEVIRNMRTGELLPPNAVIPVAKRQMLVLISDKMQLPAPASVEISGMAAVGIPAEASKAYSYGALVFDQYGDTMEGEPVEYALASPVNGVSILDDGNLVVQPDATPNQKVTITATSGGASGSFEVRLATSGSTPTNIEISGTGVLALPQSGSKSYQYKAIVTDDVGGVVDGQRVVWKLLKPVEGVSIDRSTGKILFDHTVPDGTVINVSAALDINPSISAAKEVILLTAKATDLVLVLPEQVVVDKGKGGTYSVIAYLADQQGELFSKDGITYELAEPIAGVSIDANSGLLTVDASVAEGTVIKIRALSSNPDISPKEGRITVQLNGLASISVSGADSVTVDNTAVTTKYTAEVKDRRGNIIAAGSADSKVEWSVTGSASASVSSDGLLTVQKGAKPCTITVTATSLVDHEIVGEKQVSIKNPVDLNSGGGGGYQGGGSSSGVRPPSDGNTPIENNPKQMFEDVPEGHWALNDIMALVNLGAVNGKTANTFEPDADITRAEFVKILVNALNLKAEVSSNPFKDVSVDDWYYSSVMTASALGIINGVAEDEFAPHQNITREQMAAMLYRTLSGMGIEIQAESGNSFCDFDEIDEFARLAVLSLNHANIINGVTEDAFAPKDNASRAQSAALINRIYKFIQEYSSVKEGE